MTCRRRRLPAFNDPNRIFNAVKDVIAKIGTLTVKTCRAVDPPSRTTRSPPRTPSPNWSSRSAGSARAVPGADAIVAAHAAAAHDYTTPGKPDIAGDEVDARAALIHGLVTDALAV